jgi:hypothetical protein
MNKLSNIINIILILVLAYFIATDPVNETLRMVAWILLALIVIYSIIKFHLKWNKRRLK